MQVMVRVLVLVDRVRDAACVSALALLFSLVNVQIFYRYVLGSPLSWPEEVARYLYVWIAILGVAKLFRERSHYAIDFFIAKAGKRLRLTAAVFVDTTAILFFVVALPGAWAVLTANASIRTATGLPIDLLYASLPVAIFFILPALVPSLLEHLQMLRGKAGNAQADRDGGAT